MNVKISYVVDMASGNYHHTSLNWFSYLKISLLMILICTAPSITRNCMFLHGFAAHELLVQPISAAMVNWILITYLACKESELTSAL